MNFRDLRFYSDFIFMSLPFIKLELCLNIQVKKAVVLRDEKHF